MKTALRVCILGGALFGGLGDPGPGGPASAEAAVRAQKAPPWLVWWAEGQKAARQSGKPIFMVFR